MMFILRFSIFIIVGAYLASAFLVRARCTGAKSAKLFFWGAIIVTATLLFMAGCRAYGFDRLDKRILQFLRWGPWIRFAAHMAMASILLPGMGITKKYTLLRIATVLLLILSLMNVSHMWYRLLPHMGSLTRYPIIPFIEITAALLLLIGALPRNTETATREQAAANQQADKRNSGTASFTDSPNDEEGSLDATGSKIPLPAGATRFAETLKGIEAAKDEKGSVPGGVILIVFGIIFFIVCPLAPLFFDNYDSSLITILFAVSFVVFIICIIVGISKSVRGGLAALAIPIRETIGEHLFAGETILAFNNGRRLGFDYWMHGMTPAGIVVFTNRRIFLLAFDSAFKSQIKALKKHEGVTIMTCDGMNKDQVKWGGMMTPPGLHLFARKLTLKPEGKDKPVSYAVFQFGENGRVIKQIRKRMSR